VVASIDAVDVDTAGNCDVTASINDESVTLHYIRVKVDNARHFSHFTITLQFRLQSKQAKERRSRTNEILI